MAGRAPAHHGFPVPHHVEWAHASLDVLEEAGFEAVYESGVTRPSRLAQLLRRARREVAPRGASTLVSFEVAGPARRSARPRRPSAW